MEEFKNLTINEAEYNLADGGKGKLAVFIYTGSADPKKVLDYAVSIYTHRQSYHEFIDANLDNPWTRVIISDVNAMRQKRFEKDKDIM